MVVAIILPLLHCASLAGAGADTKAAAHTRFGMEHDRVIQGLIGAVNASLKTVAALLPADAFRCIMSHYFRARIMKFSGTKVETGGQTDLGIAVAYHEGPLARLETEFNTVYKACGMALSEHRLCFFDRDQFIAHIQMIIYVGAVQDRQILLAGLLPAIERILTDTGAKGEAGTLWAFGTQDKIQHVPGCLRGYNNTVRQIKLGRRKSLKEELTESRIAYHLLGEDEVTHSEYVRLKSAVEPMHCVLNRSDLAKSLLVQAGMLGKQMPCRENRREFREVVNRHALSPMNGGRYIYVDRSFRLDIPGGKQYGKSFRYIFRVFFWTLHCLFSILFPPETRFLFPRTRILLHQNLSVSPYAIRASKYLACLP